MQVLIVVIFKNRRPFRVGALVQGAMSASFGQDNSCFQGLRRLVTRLPVHLVQTPKSHPVSMTLSIQHHVNRREALERVAWILGGVMSTELTAGVLGQVLNVGQRVNVTPETVALLAEIADVIIPDTDTPGAKAANAHQFVVRVMRDCYGYVEQEEFYREVGKFQEDTQKKFSKPFTELSAEQRIEMIRHAAVHLKGFFLRMRALTTAGYFSSEIGATKALEYLPIPGRFDGAVAMKPGQKAWAI